MPKISGKNLTEHRERTREALFAALSRLMAAKGFDAISMSDLAAEAGIGRTAIYNHFSDKEELLLAYIEFEVSAYMKRINSRLETVDSPLDRLRIYAREQMLAKRGYFFSPGAPLRDVVSKETALALRDHASITGKLFRRILNECVQAGMIPNQDLDITVQLLQGALTGRRVPKSEPERSSYLDATDHFVLRSVGAEVPNDLAPLEVSASETSI